MTDELPFDEDQATGFWASHYRAQRIRVGQLRRKGMSRDAIVQQVNQEYKTLVLKRTAWQENGEICEVHGTDIIDGRCWCIADGCPLHHTNK